MLSTQWGGAGSKMIHFIILLHRASPDLVSGEKKGKKKCSISAHTPVYSSLPAARASHCYSRSNANKGSLTTWALFYHWSTAELLDTLWWPWQRHIVCTRIHLCHCLIIWWSYCILKLYEKDALSESFMAPYNSYEPQYKQLRCVYFTKEENKTITVKKDNFILRSFCCVKTSFFFFFAWKSATGCSVAIFLGSESWYCIYAWNYGQSLHSNCQKLDNESI